MNVSIFLPFQNNSLISHSYPKIHLPISHPPTLKFHFSNMFFYFIPALHHRMQTSFKCILGFPSHSEVPESRSIPASKRLPSVTPWILHSLWQQRPQDALAGALPWPPSPFFTTHDQVGVGRRVAQPVSQSFTGLSLQGLVGEAHSQCHQCCPVIRL